MNNSLANRICLSISSENFLFVENNLSKFDGFIFEIRVDLFPDGLFPDKILKSDNKIIITCRGVNCDMEKKIKWAEKTSNLLAIDVEYNDDEFYRLREYPVVVSYHNYDCTPDFKDLSKLYERLNKSGADYIKIVTSDNSEDFKRLLNLYDIAVKNRLIAFTMGKSALISRVEALKRGAPFVFASPDRTTPVFKGQPYFEDIINLYSNE